ncbi:MULTISPECIES: hypothetical protein [unclassified Arthrobacter]|uniref:hypothetical protein n=1 Tax=unclassified Arthrobacter TaxID=235627 RepID=UPI003398BD9A
MGDSTTIALHLTFFGTLGVAFLMFLGLILLVVLTLVLAGVGRLVALTVMALFRRLPKNEILPLVRLTGPAVRKEPPALAEDWASAVAEADARAMARARAAAPEVKVAVRDLPDPSTPAAKLKAVAPLAESALHQDNPGCDTAGGNNATGEAPRSFTKPPAPATLSLLDTGSLVSLSDHANVFKAKLPADRS